MQQFNTIFVAALLLLSTFGILHAQNSQNMSLLYQYDDPAIVKYNDVWGYADNGIEVAIIGTRDSILFFNVTDTAQVDKLQGIAPGGSSNWRDFKTYGNFCYGVTEADEGLTIVDMNDLLNGTLTYQSITSDFTSAHNVWVDTATAKLYIVGANPNSGGNRGYIVYDLQADPYNPVHLATVDLTNNVDVSCNSSYIHDIFVRNDTAYCNMISDCGYYIFDVSTPASPVQLGFRESSGFQNGLNHSNWVSQDGNLAVVAEETHGNPVHFVDISDLSNMTILGTFKDPLDSGNTNNIAHNPFIKGDLCYISYYHDGVNVIDISDPANPVRVAYYDTEPNNPDYLGYEGNWGVYPYLPSGHVLASDINNGFFLLEISESVLAVEWIEFEAKATGKEDFAIFAELQSTQALEKVELYWSESGDDFKLLTPLQTEIDVHNRYTITESLPRPTPSSFYVQIRSTEVDGHRSSSVIRRVEATNSDGFHIYPNPAQTKIHVSHENAARLEIFDVLGKLVQKEQLSPGINTLLLNENLPGGMYTAIWRGADEAILESRQLYIRP